MPRVVPSQVLSFIRGTFPGDDLPAIRATPDQAPALAAIVRLVSEVPDELLTLSGSDYNELLLGIEALKEAIERWKGYAGESTFTMQSVRRINGRDPIVLIRDAIAKCPDEAPSPATLQLQFVTDLKLRDSIRQDISTATTAFHNGEWKAATVLAGAAAEALLLYAIQHGRMQTTSSTPPYNPVRPADKWAFQELIDTAEQLGLISGDTATQSRLGKNFRNLIHPGRAQRTGTSCNRATALSALASVEHIATDLS
jgi:hypothetical protein